MKGACKVKLYLVTLMKNHVKANALKGKYGIARAESKR